MCQKGTSVKKRINTAVMIFVGLAFSFLISCKTMDTDIRKEDSPYIKDHGTPPIGSSVTITHEGDLDSQIGELTYDRALLTWGEPTSVVDGDEIFLVTWGGEDSVGVIFPTAHFLWAFPISNGWKLQLYFNKTTRKLCSWKYDKW